MMNDSWRDAHGVAATRLRNSTGRRPWPCAQARYDHGYCCFAANAADGNRWRQFENRSSPPQAAVSASAHGNARGAIRRRRWRDEEIMSERKMKCQICGAPADPNATGVILCSECSKKYFVYQCSSCGSRVITIYGVADLCKMCNADKAIAHIEERVWKQIDPLILESCDPMTFAKLSKMLGNEWLKSHSCTVNDLIFARYRFLRKSVPSQFKQKTDDEYWDGFYS